MPNECLTAVLGCLYLASNSSGSSSLLSMVVMRPNSTIEQYQVTK